MDQLEKNENKIENREINEYDNNKYERKSGCINAYRTTPCEAVFICVYNIQDYFMREYLISSFENCVIQYFFYQFYDDSLGIIFGNGKYSKDINLPYTKEWKVGSPSTAEMEVVIRITIKEKAPIRDNIVGQIEQIVQNLKAMVRKKWERRIR